jgi:hypothetical protein
METGGSKKKLVTAAGTKRAPKAGSGVTKASKQAAAAAAKTKKRGGKVRPAGDLHFSRASLKNQLRLGGVHTYRLENMKPVEYARGVEELYLEPLAEMARGIAALVADRSAGSAEKGVRITRDDLDFINERPRRKKLVGITDVELGRTKSARGKKKV